MNRIDKLPFVWTSQDAKRDDLALHLNQHFDKVKEQLLSAGAVLFKGFQIDSAEKLEIVTEACPGTTLKYAGGNSPRTKLMGNVYSSTEYPDEAFISLHNELSYAHRYPRYLLFSSQLPAKEGGETPIVDSRLLLKSLPVEVTIEFRRKGVKYIRNLHGNHGFGISWQQAFETGSKLLVERHCKLNNIRFSWHGDNSLRLEEDRPAVIIHPDTDEEVWFNQADQFHPSTNSEDIYHELIKTFGGKFQAMPQYACFGDGTAIPTDFLDEIRKVTERLMVYRPWEKGDLLMVDNLLVAHGRMPFVGPRKTLVAMLTD